MMSGSKMTYKQQKMLDTFILGIYLSLVNLIYFYSLVDGRRENVATSFHNHPSQETNPKTNHQTESKETLAYSGSDY